MKSPQNHTLFLIFIATSFFITSAVGKTALGESANGFVAGKRVNAITFISNSLVLAGSDNGLYRSSDTGETWVASNNGIGDSVISSILFDVHLGLFVGTISGTYRSTDDGLTWFKLVVFPQIRVHSIVSDSIEFIFAATDSGVYRSNDTGNSWTQINTGLTDVQPSSFVRSSAGTLFCGTFNGGVFRSTNSGETWTHTNLSDPYVNDLVISLNGTVFACTSIDIYQSTDSGNTWTPSGFEYVNSLATNPSGAIFVGVWFCEATPNCGLENPGGLYRSTNDGVTWDYIGFSYSNFIVLSTNLENQVFRQTETGIFYRSPDNGSSWSQISLPVSFIQEIPAPLPVSYTLKQNHPNPFNPNTEIQYGLPEDCAVTLKIYDVLGREITALVNEFQEAGYKSVQWDAANSPSGVYFYKLQAGSFTQVRKMLLLK